MAGINIEEKIANNVKQAIKEFEAREDIVTRFGEPIISYIDARDQLFNLLFDKDLTEHPKNIYRPGNTVITYFIPYAEEITESNQGGGQVSEQWRRASIESAWLSMKSTGPSGRRSTSSEGFLRSSIPSSTGTKRSASPHGPISCPPMCPAWRN